MDLALGLVGQFRGWYGRIPFDAVVEQIERYRVPLGAYIDWIGDLGNGGHFVAITGWSISPANVQQLLVSDPLRAGPVRLSYMEMVNQYPGGPRGGRWQATYFISGRRT